MLLHHPSREDQHPDRAPRAEQPQRLRIVARLAEREEACALLVRARGDEIDADPPLPVRAARGRRDHAGGRRDLEVGTRCGARTSTRGSPGCLTRCSRPRWRRWRSASGRRRERARPDGLWACFQGFSGRPVRRAGGRVGTRSAAAWSPVPSQRVALGLAQKAWTASVPKVWRGSWKTSGSGLRCSSPSSAASRAS